MALAQLAEQMLGSLKPVNVTLLASSINAATATPLPSDSNFITASPGGSNQYGGLPPAVGGESIFVTNNLGSGQFISPAVGETINGLAPSAGLNVFAGECFLFVAARKGNWRTFKSA